MAASERISLLMKSKNVKQKELAEAIGLSSQAVSKWVNGGHISDENIEKLSSFFEVSPTYIRYGVDAQADVTDVAEQIAARLRRFSDEKLNAVRLIVESMPLDR